MKEIVWRAHPARERPAVTLALLVVIGLVLSVIWFTFRDRVLLALSVAIFAGALSAWFLPTKFRLGDDGAFEERGRMKRARRWAEIRSVYADRHGATLSPFAKPSWLEPYRGMRLLFSGNRDAVLAALEEMVPDRCRTKPKAAATERRSTIAS